MGRLAYTPARSLTVRVLAQRILSHELEILCNNFVSHHSVRGCVRVRFLHNRRTTAVRRRRKVNQLKVSPPIASDKSTTRSPVGDTRPTQKVGCSYHTSTVHVFCGTHRPTVFEIETTFVVDEVIKWARSSRGRHARRRSLLSTTRVRGHGSIGPISRL